MRSKQKRKEREDLTGRRFGRLVVLGFAFTVDGRSSWNCRCECGTEKAINRQNLLRGSTRSCGCKLEDYLESIRGEKNPHAKFTAEQVLAMRAEFADGGTTKVKLAQRYGVGKRMIGKILSGETWKHVGGQIACRTGPKLTEESEGAIRSEYAKGTVSQNALAALYGVSTSTVSSVIKGTHRKSDAISLLLNRVSKLEEALQRLQGAAPAPRTPKAIPTEEDALLDEIARGMAKKPFSKLSTEHQDVVRSIAERLKADQAGGGVS